MGIDPHAGRGNAASTEQTGERPATAAVAADRPAAPAPFPLLTRARTLVLWAVVAAVLYSTLASSRGSCSGGFSSGGYVDADGHPTTVAPQCVQLVLQPGPLVYLAIALTVIVALSTAARAVDLDAALRTLNRGTIVAVGIAVVSMVVAIAWFFALPMPGPGDGVLFPFPFGSGTMTVTPLESGTAG